MLISSSLCFYNGCWVWATQSNTDLMTGNALHVRALAVMHDIWPIMGAGFLRSSGLRGLSQSSPHQCSV